ncbi:BAI1-associated protein 3-like [Lethenteron reissneri]|uniref:BAI1-associated protein 3-like n=1 Tax=Lethenteron reissneri TaxID=7753 RepID=UPI002AB78758|nr:BAI1-associated protein 3-like [Lethenteron reissneri]
MEALDSEVDTLYEDTVYMVQHWIGERENEDENNISRNQLLIYVQQVFNKSVDEHLAAVNKVKNRAPPSYTLFVEVIEARNLAAKDVNGFSDPYCIFGMIQGSGNREVTPNAWDAADKKKKRHSDAKPLAEENKCSFSKSTCMTKIKTKTLNPVWNESFSLDVTDIKNGVFHLDIWDYDEDLTVVDAVKTLHEVHTIKGVHRYLKQVVKSVKSHSAKEEEDDGAADDFLGCVDISLKELSLAGREEWFHLQKQPSFSNVSGDCHLSLHISAKEASSAGGSASYNSNAPPKQRHPLKIQLVLLTVLLRHELKVMREVQDWSGELSTGATRILALNSMQTGLTSSQKAMARWIVYSTELCSRGVHYEMLQPCLEEMQRTWKRLDAQSPEAQLLCASFTAYVDGLLSKLRQIPALPAGSEDATAKLQAMLCVLAQLYKTEAFQQLCAYHGDLEGLITTAIQEGTGSWYKSLAQPDKDAQENASEDAAAVAMRGERERLTQLSAIVEKVTAELGLKKRCYQELFLRSVNVDYFNIVYCLLETLVADTVQRVAEDMSQLLKDAEDGHSDCEVGEMLFVVYVHLKELHGLHQHVTDRATETLALFGFHKWFQPAINKWFVVIQQKIHDRIRKAVSIDSLEAMDSLVFHSTSAVDTATCLSQLEKFWHNLAWPEPLEAFVLATKLTQDICDASVAYATLIHQKLEQCPAEPAGRESKVSTQLCAVVGDLDFVREKLLLFPEQLGWEEFGAAIGDHGKQVQTALYGQLHGAQDDLACQANDILTSVPTRMLLDLKQRVASLVNAPDYIQPPEALSPLIEYLEASLFTFNQRLSNERCIRIMQTVWTALLDIFTDAVRSRQSHCVSFDVRFHYSLLALRETFHADGEGLLPAVLESDAFQVLEKKLRLKTLSTVELIEEFYLERIKEQELCHQSGLGELRVRCWHAESRLHVEVLNGMGLPAMDSNGLSDPFVTLDLCPHHHFPLAKSARTQTQSNTLNPIFGETFEFPVSEEQCRSRSACVLMTVMDFDLFTANDYIGQTVLRLDDVACVDTRAAPPELPQRSLPLMDKSLHADIDILQILEERSDEKDVQELLKKWK